MKTIAITGAASGIGAATAIALANAGVRVSIAGRRIDALKATATSLGKQAGAVVSIDVTGEAAVTKGIAQIAAEAGPIDILVNNAGITRDGLFVRMSDADWDAVVENNPRLAINAMQTIGQRLDEAHTRLREMSTLATPPEDRHPILTYVGAYERKQVSAAVRRELLRDGQVFYVHNNVGTIEKAAARIRELVPDARVETAHGKMGEHRLEQVVLDFWERRFDVLVCTTIVETGLDISNANTLIIDRADKLGLSQLHQLRGRVGRGRERAYAYFMYPGDKPLTETAHDRLATIAGNTDLGAGMRVAMKDLEIRGAGNLLGGEQSGHIAGVGFDLYVRMVGEAVADFRGDEPDRGPAEIKIELPVDAHLPHDYVPGERLRLDAYRTLAQASDVDGIREVEAEPDTTEPDTTDTSTTDTAEEVPA